MTNDWAGTGAEPPTVVGGFAPGPGAVPGVDPRSEPRRKVTHPMVVRRATVARAVMVTPGIRRVTVVGPELAGFTSLGPADHLKAFFPDPETGEYVVLDPADGGARGPAGGETRSAAGRGPTVRDYTPRAYRPGPDGGELDVDFVLHERGGPAAGWAAEAEPGVPFVLAGPKGSRLVPEGVTGVVVGGDESALPAMARWLELLPVGVSVTVVAEVADVAEEAYLAGIRTDAELHWLHRDGCEPGSTTLLEEAVRALPAPAHGTHLWFGGEAASLAGVRRYLRRELALPASRAEVSGYWRRGIAAFDHHAPVDSSDPD